MERMEPKRNMTGWILGTLTGMYLLSALLLLILALVMYKFDLSQQIAKIAILFIYIASSFLGGFLVGKKKKVRKFLWGLIMGLAYFAVLLVISLAVSGGKIDDIVQVLTTLVLCTAASMIGGMVS